MLEYKETYQTQICSHWPKNVETSDDFDREDEFNLK